MGKRCSKTENDVLKQEKDVLKQEKDVLKQKIWSFYFKNFNSFCPGTSRDRGFCPGTFAPALVPGQRDTGTRKFFCPGTKGQRDVPSRGNPTLNHCDQGPLKTRTTDTQWRHKSKKSENLGRCGRQNILWPYLKVWEWEWIFGRAVKAIFLLGVRIPCLKIWTEHSPLSHFLKLAIPELLGRTFWTMNWPLSSYNYLIVLTKKTIGKIAVSFWIV
jgi:hypothetical protein